MGRTQTSGKLMFDVPMRLATRRVIPSHCAVRASLAALLVALLTTLGCGGLPPAPKSAPAGEADAAQVTLIDARTDVFAARAKVKPFASARPFSLGIDPEVVERLIRQRLRQVESNALRDLLREGGDTKPIRDFLHSLAAIVVDVTDAETRSQAILSAMLRDSLSLGIARLTFEGYIDGGTCSTAASDECSSHKGAKKDWCEYSAKMKRLSDAAYEGLATSRYLTTLGFPLSDQTVAKGCADYSLRVGELVDATVAIVLDKKAFEDLSEKATSIKNDCTVLLEAQTTSSLRLLYNATSKLEADDVRGWANLMRAYGDARALLAEQGDAKASKCLGLLDDFRVAFLPVARFAYDLQVTFRVSEVVGVIERVETFAKVGELQKHALYKVMRKTASDLVDGGKIRRGDLIALIGVFSSEWARKRALVDDTVLREVVDAVFDILPQAIREDDNSGAGIALDTPALASSVASRYANQSRIGWYLRATVGAGYVAQFGHQIGASYYEELGFGYRWGGTKILHGWHLTTSGLLFNVTSQHGTEKSLFLGAGYSINIYRAIDVSLSLGALSNLGTTLSNPRFATCLGLHLPLPDYFKEVTSGSTEAQASTKGKP